jgi:hypothetical protein
VHPNDFAVRKSDEEERERERERGGELNTFRG